MVNGIYFEMISSRKQDLKKGGFLTRFWMLITLVSTSRHHQLPLFESYRTTNLFGIIEKLQFFNRFRYAYEHRTFLICILSPPKIFSPLRCRHQRCWPSKLNFERNRVEIPVVHTLHRMRFARKSTTTLWFHYLPTLMKWKPYEQPGSDWQNRLTARPNVCRAKGLWFPGPKGKRVSLTTGPNHFAKWTAGNQAHEIDTSRTRWPHPVIYG